MADFNDHSPDDNPKPKAGTTRRGFLTQLGIAGGGLTLAPLLAGAAENTAETEVMAAPAEITAVNLTINGRQQLLHLDSRVTLLDALREKLALPGTKKGCDHGQCGACTVLVDGRRINSCLTLAGMCDGAEGTTIAGLAKGDG